MTAYIKPGSRMRLPSGVLAIFLGWRVRRVNSHDVDSKMERVAILRAINNNDEILVSERFIKLCKVM